LSYIQRKTTTKTHATLTGMVIVALVGYHEQRGKRNWMRSSSNPRRKGAGKTETFIFPLFVPFSYFRVRNPVSRVFNG